MLEDRQEVGAQELLNGTLNSLMGVNHMSCCCTGGAGVSVQLPRSATATAMAVKLKILGLLVDSMPMLHRTYGSSKRKGCGMPFDAVQSASGEFLD
jgi:hypothetical protein